MQVYTFSDKNHRDRLSALFLNHFKRQDIIPFFGSGFSRGYPAKGGQVPSVYELKREMIDIIAGIENYSAAERKELEHMSLSQLADNFWPALEHEQASQQYCQRFQNYMEEHFCNVHDIPREHKLLIDCRWRYLYTLNYDDAIESISSELHVITPYVSQNRLWLANKRCLYKIHGDAKKYLETGDSKYCILSTKQYLHLLGDDTNYAMRQNLETDFSSNNLIFFGCSLVDELDILFAAGTGSSERKRENLDTFSYFIRYIDNETPPLTRVQMQTLENFAITHIVEVKAEEMLAFYSFLATLSAEAGKLQKTDSLDEFTAFRFSQMDSLNPENIEYLFYSSRIWPDAETKYVQLPNFFIRRDETQRIISAINSARGSFHVLRGRRLSGKTYVLIDLLKEFQARKTYYFSSGKQISDQYLEKLCSLKDAILLFDEHCLTSDQLTEITTEYRERIKKNNLQIVTAIDQALGMFTNHYFERFPDMKGFVNIYTLSFVFNEDEISRFNEEFGKLGMINYEKGWSLLDFMLKADDASTKKHKAQLPDIHVIPDKETLKALIVFTNQESIHISQANAFGITQALYNLCKTADVAIQKDFLSEAELVPDMHGSFRFATNSAYWVYKCLWEHAKNHANYNAIATVYHDIVEELTHRYNSKKMSRRNYFQAIKPYYFFETIQFTFFSDPQQSGSLVLPETIYKTLLPLCKNDFQFLHQNAKCLLWNSRRKKTIPDQISALNSAHQQIMRARTLAEQYAPPNIEYTLYHMDVTRTLILINDWRYCSSQPDNISEEELSRKLTELINIFYEMEKQMLRWGNNPDLDDREIKDIKWFITQIGAGSVLQHLQSEGRKIAGQILTLGISLQLYKGLS